MKNLLSVFPKIIVRFTNLNAVQLGVAVGVPVAVGALVIVGLVLFFVLRKSKGQKRREPTAEEPQRPEETTGAEEVALSALPEAVPEDVFEPALKPAPALQAVPKPAPAMQAVPKPVPAPVAEKTASKELYIVNEEIDVCDMSPAMRAALNVTGEEHALERYSVRYSYSFRARLSIAPQKIKDFYREVAADFAAYKGVKIAESFRQQRVYKGRDLFALFVFKGKTLCVAFALDPAVYAETKYRGKDVGHQKRFEKTPMLFRLATPRKAKYAKYLFAQLAAENGLVQNEVKPYDDIAWVDRDALIADGEIRVTGVQKRSDQPPTAFKHAETPAAALPEEDGGDRSAKRDRGGKKFACTVSTTILNRNFSEGETVTLAELRARGLVPKNATRVKVLMGVPMNKALTVAANDFSQDALDAIREAGGTAVKTSS